MTTPRTTHTTTAGDRRGGTLRPRVLAALAATAAAAGLGLAATTAGASYPQDPPGCSTNPEYAIDGSTLRFEGKCKSGKSFRIEGRILLKTGGRITVTGPANNKRFPADNKVHGFSIPIKQAGGVERVDYTRALR